MRLTPAQEVTLWEIDRSRMGDRTESGRQGWVVRTHWNTNTLRALQRRGLLEFSPLNTDGTPTFLVRLTREGNLRVPTL